MDLVSAINQTFSEKKKEKHSIEFLLLDVPILPNMVKVNVTFMVLCL